MCTRTCTRARWGRGGRLQALREDDAAERAVSLSAFFAADGAKPAAAPPGESAGAAEPEDEDELKLTAEQAACLTASAAVRAAVRDPRLQEVLRHIDGAASRETALRRLEEVLGRDADFEEFAATALREIGHRAAEAEPE